MLQKMVSACHFLSCLLAAAGRLAGIMAILCLLCACIPPGGRSVTPGSPGSPAPAASSGSALETPTAPAAAPTSTAEVGLCRLGELSASIEWQKSSGALDARLVLANFGAQACVLQGAPQIVLANENGWKLPVDQVQNSSGKAPAKVLLDPGSAGYTAEARFVWRNWCAPVKKENLHLEVDLPGYPGKLNVPVQDPNGHYLADTPRCDDLSAPSTLTIEPFK